MIIRWGYRQDVARYQKHNPGLYKSYAILPDPDKMANNTVLIKALPPVLGTLYLICSDKSLRETGIIQKYSHLYLPFLEVSSPYKKLRR